VRKQIVGLAIAAVGGILASATIANAADIRVLSSNAIKEAYLEFGPLFEKSSGHKLHTTWDGTANIMKKMRAGEQFDMVVLASPQLDELVKEGKIVAGSGVALVRSGIGVGIPLGAPKPDLSNSEAVKKALLAAKGVGYSTGPSGVFLESLFTRWGLADAIKAKVRKTPTGVPVGTLIVKGEVDIGFQQISEIMLFPGIQYVGEVPKDMQHITVFSGGVHAAAKQAEAARALLKFILSPAALPAIKHSGLEQGS
jgi:molybdate transport system substrate-binding protein